MDEALIKLQKHTLLFFPGDYARMQSIYPETGAAKAIRILVRKHLDDVESKVKAPKLRAVDLEGAGL